MPPATAAAASAYGPWINLPPDPAAAEGVFVSSSSLEEGKKPRLRLFCVPQAGCGAWAFHGWSGRLPPGVELMPIELPGRNTRRGEPPDAHATLEALAKAAVDALAEPHFAEDAPEYALFGHSVGAWLAFEMTLEIERRVAAAQRDDGHPPLRPRLKPPRFLCACGARAPRDAGPARDPDASEPSLGSLPDAKFWRAFERRYGANPDLQSPEVRAMALPVLRVDFKRAEAYGGWDEDEEEEEEEEEEDEKGKMSSCAKNATRRALRRTRLVVVGAVGDARTPEGCLERWFAHAEGVARRAVWVAGVDPRWAMAGRPYWGTPHRLVMDFPDELLREIGLEIRQSLVTDDDEQSYL